MEEIWKDVVGFEGIYQVSNLGHVRRIAPWADGRKRSFGQSLGSVGVRGYVLVMLCKPGESKRPTLKVHRLVLAAFVGLSDQEVNHKNGIKTDNRLENLEYCTSSENAIHRFKVLHIPTRQGSKHPMAKVTEADVLAIRNLASQGLTWQTIANKFGLGKTETWRIIKRKNWTHVA